MHEILGIDVPTSSAEALLYDASVPHVITTRAIILLDGFYILVDGTVPDECDPYLQLGFTCEEQCVEAENLGSLMWTMRSNSCAPGGGGSGGTTGGGGGGGGTGSGSGTGDFDDGAALPPAEDIRPDTVILAPSCPVAASAPAYQKAWCAGKLPNPTQRERVDSVISRMAALGGICATFATRAGSLFNAGRIRVFSRSDANTGGVGFGDGIAILDRRVDAYYETPFELEGYKVNLQFVVAHEAWHSLYGSAPGSHTVIAGTGGWYQETPGAKECSGL
jgi:hypothetical protein